MIFGPSQHEILNRVDCNRIKPTINQRKEKQGPTNPTEEDVYVVLYRTENQTDNQPKERAKKTDRANENGNVCIVLYGIETNQQSTNGTYNKDQLTQQKR